MRDSFFLFSQQEEETIAQTLSHGARRLERELQDLYMLNNVSTTSPTTDDERCEVLQYSHDPLLRRPLRSPLPRLWREEKIYPILAKHASFIKLRRLVRLPGFNYAKQVAVGDALWLVWHSAIEQDDTIKPNVKIYIYIYISVVYILR